MVVPLAEGGLRQDAFTRDPNAEKFGKRAGSSSKHRNGSRSSTRVSRGRYCGASASKRDSSRLALDATLRAAAGTSAAGAALNPRPALRVAPDALRFKRFKGRAGALFIFLVDTSGSMAANRIAQAKGALAQLLRRSYVNRDRVALVTFRGAGAELLLAPSASASRARALLDVLPVSGATPLAAGLLRALEVARRSTAQGACQLRLVVFTDGRANVPLAGKVQTLGTAGNGNKAALKERIRAEVRALGASLSKEGVASLVIDTQAHYTDGGDGRFLSDALGGRYLRLPQVFDEATFLN